MLLRLRDLLYPHSTGLELRNTCNRVKCVVGQRVGCTFRVVERDEDYTFLDVGGDPGTYLDLPSAGDGLDHLFVLDIEGFCILGVDLYPAGGSSRSRLSERRVIVPVCHCQIQRPVVRISG